MAELTKRRSSGVVGALIVLAIEAFVFALTIAMILSPGGELLIVEVVLGGGAIFYLRKKPAAAAWVKRLFAENRAASIAGLVVMLLAVPFAVSSSPYWLFILITAGLYIIACLGLNMQLGSTGMMNLAGAAFNAFGAYTAALITLNWGWPTWLTLILGALVTGLFSVLLFIPVLKTKGHYLALVTIAFQFMVVILLDNMEWTGGPQGLKNIPLFNFAGYSFNNPLNLGFTVLPHYANYYYFMLILILLACLVAYWVYHSWVGVTLATIRDDEVAARTNGVRHNYWKLVIFVLGNCFIGLSGAFYAHMVGYIAPPNFAFDKSLVMVSVVILGGMDNIIGIILGSILLIVLPEKLRFIQEFRFMIYGLVLVVMLIFQPRGLIPFVPRSYTNLIRKVKPAKAPEFKVKEAGGEQA